ncbi:MAG TPA: tetraacyldisaccharide 4'-kinase [Thermoanaerobaculia bacterium]|jgi:tetraacyldisaccharide 4'-kinase|nr:tetraacyldisaccharide 4'-kinase [Thermoanaerobaculia bacterium]
MDTAVAAGLEISLGQPPPAGSPWQRLYAAAHRLRRRWYRARASRLPLPVISVGNLHWGGGGKTPLVAAVAAHLRQRGLAVCILSRGYGRRGGGGVRIVSRGDGPLLTPAEAGDEPVLLAGELPGVAVVVGADRHRAGLEALARLRPAPDLFLLDDGFSHLGLHRDLDLLAFPAADPFGGGRLWPGGRLREPLAASARADAALLTGTPEPGQSAANEAEANGESPVVRAASTDASTGARGPANSAAAVTVPGPGAALAAALRPYGFSGPGFACALRAGAAVLHGPAGIVPLAAGSRVLLVSAIARPERFAATVRELDFAVMAELRFPDHHTYPPASLARIAARAAASGAAAVLVTAKDRVKLLGRLAAPLAELPVAAEPEPAFWTWLDAATDRHLAAPAANLGPHQAGGGSER